MKKRDNNSQKNICIKTIFIVTIIFEIFYLNYIFSDPVSTNNEKTDDLNTENNIDNERIDSLNGSATAFFYVQATQHSSYPMYHTIYLYDDLTCEVGNNKQLKESNQDWPPNDPNAKWQYTTDYFFGSCNYTIINSDDSDYIILLYSYGKNIDSKEKVSVLYRIQSNKAGQVYYLESIPPSVDRTRKYYYTYKEGKNFLELEKEEIKKANEELSAERKKFVGNWINEYKEIILNEDGTCMIDLFESFEKVTTCNWKPKIGENLIYLEYSSNYTTDFSREYSISEDLSTLKEEIAGDTPQSGYYKRK